MSHYDALALVLHLAHTSLTSGDDEFTEDRVRDISYLDRELLPQATWASILEEEPLDGEHWMQHRNTNGNDDDYDAAQLSSDSDRSTASSELRFAAEPPSQLERDVQEVGGRRGEDLSAQHQHFSFLIKALHRMRPLERNLDKVNDMLLLDRLQYWRQRPGAPGRLVSTVYTRDDPNTLGMVTILHGSSPRCTLTRFHSPRNATRMEYGSRRQPFAPTRPFTLQVPLGD